MISKFGILTIIIILIGLNGCVDDRAGSPTPATKEVTETDAGTGTGDVPQDDTAETETQEEPVACSEDPNGGDSCLTDTSQKKTYKS